MWVMPQRGEVAAQLTAMAASSADPLLQRAWPVDACELASADAVAAHCLGLRPSLCGTGEGRDVCGQDFARFLPAGCCCYCCCCCLLCMRCTHARTLPMSP